MAAAPQPGTSQVLLRDTGLRFDADGVDVLHYDHASRLLLAVRRSSIAVYNVDRPSQPAEVRHHPYLSHCGARNGAQGLSYSTTRYTCPIKKRNFCGTHVFNNPAPHLIAVF